MACSASGRSSIGLQAGEGYYVNWEVYYANWGWLLCKLGWLFCELGRVKLEEMLARQKRYLEQEEAMFSRHSTKTLPCTGVEGYGSGGGTGGVTDD